MPQGFVYILKCNDGSYYTGSTIDISKKLTSHNEGLEANHTKKQLPVELVYLEKFQSIEEAFDREKQIQGWSREKKEDLIKRNFDKGGFESISNHEQAFEPEALNVTKIFRSNGKLLLTGEYVVLDGAKALALPTKYGQSLSIKPIDQPKIFWKSFDELGAVWFEDVFSFNSEKLTHQNTNNQVSIRLQQILTEAKKINPAFLRANQGYVIETHLDFNKNWGLGTSSTLVNNLANWAQVDAYTLLENTFGGSGYDIACASRNTPITYQLSKNSRQIISANFNPLCKENLFFVFLNKKQNSREGISAYKKNNSDLKHAVSEISAITDALISCTSFSEFQKLITTHETIIASVTKQTPLKNSLFNDFDGSIKSLGAWGGDFILVASESDPTPYFKAKGFETIIRYKDMLC